MGFVTNFMVRLILQDNDRERNGIDDDVGNCAIEQKEFQNGNNGNGKYLAEQWPKRSVGMPRWSYNNPIRPLNVFFTIPDKDRPS